MSSAPEDEASPREARKQRRQQRRREAILDAAYDLLREVGANNFTIAAVAARADISKPSVYYYFATREALVGALGERLVSDEVEALLPVVAAAPDGVAALQAQVRAKIARWRDDPEAFRVLYLVVGGLGRATPDALARIYATANRLNDLLERRLTEDHAAGALAADVVPREFVNLAFMSVQGILVTASSMAAMGGALRFRPEALGESLCALLARGARPDQGAERATR